MKKHYLFFAIIMLCTCCSSPYEKGVTMADEYNECISSYLEALDKVGDDFAGELPGSYTSRKAAMNDYLALMRECHQKYLNTWNEIERNELETRKDFKSTAEVSEFESALYENKKNVVFCNEPSLETGDFSEEVLRNVRKINPPKPNENQIKLDLVGHSLSEGKQMGYYPQSWRWNITENGISDFQILSVEEDSKTNYVITVSMRLSSDTRAFDAKAKICYKLDDINDWQIEFVQSMGMDIVKTHRYDDCVKCSIKRGWAFGHLVAENNCEVALEVAGREIQGGEWVPFSRIIPPHTEIEVSIYDTDFIVDYVERP